LSEAGIHLQERTISKILAKKLVVVFLDNAQAKYDQGPFWEELIKSTSLWMPENIRFVISATHFPSQGSLGLVDFVYLPKIERDSFRLTEYESNEFLELPVIGLPQKLKSETLKRVLIRECGGLIGALRLSIDSLEERFAKDIQPLETDVLQYFLSDKVLQSMTPCFGSAHALPIGPDFKTFMKKVFVDKRLCPSGFTNPQDGESYSSLENAGILELPDSKSFGFSSPLAKRYYFKWLFPSRSETSPSSLQELIRKVVSNMSCTALTNSSLPGDFPNKAVFQLQFVEGLALHTPPCYSICPDLLKVFSSDINPNTQQAIAREVDFYLNGSERWGIELLVNGDGIIGESVSRFSPLNGKYVSLAVHDYVVVDIRRNATGQPTDISKHPNLVSVFFKNNDYSVAQCVFGEDAATIEIRLAH
jgi:hypothetical protein